jgi:hypothetical protein
VKLRVYSASLWISPVGGAERRAADGALEAELGAVVGEQRHGIVGPRQGQRLDRLEDLDRPGGIGESAAADVGEVQRAGGARRPSGSRRSSSTTSPTTATSAGTSGINGTLLIKPVAQGDSLQIVCIGRTGGSDEIAWEIRAHLRAEASEGEA